MSTSSDVGDIITTKICPETGEELVLFVDEIENDVGEHSVTFEMPFGIPREAIEGKGDGSTATITVLAPLNVDEQAAILTDSVRIIDSLKKQIILSYTISQLDYILRQLEASRFEASTAYFQEQEALKAAFSIGYAKLFTSTRGVARLKRNQLPSELFEHHERLMKLRNKRYAHSDTDDESDPVLKIRYDAAKEAYVVAQAYELRVTVGPDAGWRPLIDAVASCSSEMQRKTLEKLSKKTGKRWEAVEGPLPTGDALKGF